MTMTHFKLYRMSTCVDHNEDDNSTPLEDSSSSSSSAPAAQVLGTVIRVQYSTGQCKSTESR